MILAIDPGVKGSLVVLDGDGEYVDHLLTPVIKTGKSSRVNGAAAAAFVAKHEPTKAYIERVHAMPGQGVTSMFSFGHAAGVVEGVVSALTIPYEVITPQEWKKHFGLTGKDKDAARSKAAQLYPGVRDLDLKGKGQAIADALFIGLYGIEKANGVNQ